MMDLGAPVSLFFAQREFRRALMYDLDGNVSTFFGSRIWHAMKSQPIPLERLL